MLKEVWQAFFNRLNKATFSATLIFVIVAVVIVMILCDYAITNVSKYGRNDVMKMMLKN